MGRDPRIAHLWFPGSAGGKLARATAPGLPTQRSGRRDRWFQALRSGSPPLTFPLGTSMSAPRRYLFGIRPVFTVFLLLVCGLILAAYVLPAHSESRKSIASRISSNLLRIEVAKALWAASHGGSIPSDISLTDLADVYPGANTFGQVVTPVAGEHYAVNPLGIRPAARLIRPLGRWSAGTNLQRGTNGALEIIVPNNGAAVDAGFGLRFACGPARSGTTEHCRWAD